MQPPRLDRRISILLAFACGAAVANIYYAQPLLAEISRDLEVSAAVVGLLVTASQVGYAIGLAFVVPLGDLLERRKLIQRLFLASGVALAVTAFAPTFVVLAVSLIAVGVAATVAQVIVPAAASLAADHERGRIVGTVMSGLLIGILIARTISGVLAEIGGWRLPFAVGTVLMLVMAATIAAVLPSHQPETKLRYAKLLSSVWDLVKEEPVLRWRMLFGAARMCSFVILWTALTFLLAEEYGYSEATIGLFGLFGIAGALAAQISGRVVDRGHLELATGAFSVVILFSWVVLAAGSSSLVALIAGILLLDFGVQGQQICNQNAIFALRPESRSRVTTAYMTNNFLWGAIASAAASVGYATGGWTAIIALGGAVASIGLIAWVIQYSRPPASAASGRSSSSGAESRSASGS